MYLFSGNKSSARRRSVGRSVGSSPLLVEGVLARQLPGPVTRRELVLANGALLPLKLRALTNDREKRGGGRGLK